MDVEVVVAVDVEVVVAVDVEVVVEVDVEVVDVAMHVLHNTGHDLWSFARTSSSPALQNEGGTLHKSRGSNCPLHGPRDGNVDVDVDVVVDVVVVVMSQPHMFGQFSETYLPRYVAVVQCLTKFKLQSFASRPHGLTVGNLFGVGLVTVDVEVVVEGDVEVVVEVDDAVLPSQDAHITGHEVSMCSLMVSTSDVQKLSKLELQSGGSTLPLQVGGVYGVGGCFGVRYEVAEDGYTIPVARSMDAVTADALSSLDVGFL